MAAREEISDKVNILLALYKHNAEMGRHHQMLRERTTNIIILLIGAIIGFILYDKRIDNFDLYPSLFMSFLGFFGAIWCRKYHERYAWYMHRGSAYRDELSELFPDLRIIELKDKADKETTENYKIINKMKLTSLWVAAHLIIGFLGLWLALISYNE